MKSRCTGFGIAAGRDQQRRRRYSSLVDRLRSKWGSKFRDVGYAMKFVPYYESGQRIEVVTRYPGGETIRRRGYVSSTGGWEPSFMLMGRCGQMSSSDLLGPNDKIVRVFPKYCQAWAHHD